MKEPIPCCEWCSEPLDAAGECPNEMCEGNLPEPALSEMDDNFWKDWSDE